MSNKINYNNKTIRVAVASNIELVYKPIKFGDSFSDYQYPEQFCSKNGKFDTSRKFINIGGAKNKYLTNNDYDSYSKYLKKIHVNKKMNIPRDGVINSVQLNDAKAENIELPVYKPPKISKQFVYKKDKVIAKGLSSLDFRINKLEGLDYDSDSVIENGGFWETPIVQGFDHGYDIPLQGKRLKTQIDRIDNIVKSKTEDPCQINEKNQLVATVKRQLLYIDQAVADLSDFRDEINLQFEKALQIPRVMGNLLSINSTFGKVNNIVDVVHNKIVDNDAAGVVIDTVNNINVCVGPFSSLIDSVKVIYNKIVEFVDTIKNKIISLFPDLSAWIEYLNLGFILHFLMQQLESLLFSYESYNMFDYIGLIIAVLPNAFRNEALKGCLASALGFYFGNHIWKKSFEGIRAYVQGKDNYVLPFATCFAVALTASNNLSMIPAFLQSIKSFGGILAFSGKFDLLLRNVFDIIPNVLKEYMRYYVPLAFESMQLGWFDEEFKKDYNDLFDLCKDPQSVYYSSTKTKKFIDVFNKMKEIYIPKYGHYDFFVKSTFFDRVDLVHSEVKRRGLLPGRRHCPFVVWLGGDSGVGKSTFAQYLATQFIDPQIAYEKQVYSWNPVLEYQDGYNNQPIVILNDYMQTTDHGEEQILISMKDACDWYLNMSSIDNDQMGKKGEVRFTSKLIIITSNMTHLYQSPFIRDIGAFNRRRDMLIEMTFNSGDKFNHERSDYSWCKFTICDPLHHSVGDPISRDKLIQSIQRKYEVHFDISTNRVLHGLRIQGDEFEDANDYIDFDRLRVSIIKRCKEISVSSFDFICDHYKSILTGVFIGGIAIWKIIGWITGKPWIQAFNSGDDITISKIHPVVVNRLNRTKIQGVDCNDDAILNKISQNIFRITTCIKVDDRSSIRSVNCIYIGNDLILFPKHAFYRGISEIEIGDLILINRGDVIFETTYDPKRRIDSDVDYVFYDVSFIMPRFKNIMKLFDDGIQPLSNGLQLVALKLTFDGNKVENHSFTGNFIKSVSCVDGEGSNEKLFVGNMMVSFRSMLRVGDCGSPIISKIGGNYKILGIHVGGTDTVQYAQLTDLRKFSPNNDFPEIQGMTDKMDFNHGKGQFIISRDVDPHYYPYQNTQTSISRSICYEILQQHTTEPAILSPGDKRNKERVSPIMEGTIQSGKIVNPISVIDFPEILQYLRRRHRMLYSTQYQILSISDAINGIEGLDRIDFQTSPGYPFTIGTIRKHDLFTFDGYIWKSTKLFDEHYNQFISDSKERGMHIVWTNCVKDERRPIAKINKARIFTVSNILLTILGRQIFGTYVSRYVKHRISHGGCVGMNPYGSEWQRLWDYLNKYRNANDGDYSKYDKDLLKELFELFYYFICEIIPDDQLYGKNVHWWIKEILTTTLFSETLTIIDGIKCMALLLHGGPSGWFLTVFFNDICNKIYMYYCWMHSIPRTVDRVQLYMDNVNIVFYGDDNLYTVSDEYCDRFNTKVVSDILIKNLNVTYTSGDKSDTITFNKLLIDCTFLKNHFVTHYSGQIVAGLDKNTIQEMVSWTRDNDRSLEQILNTCLRFSYFWGPQYFNQNYQKLKNYCDNLITYQEIDYEFQSNNGLNFEIYDKMEIKKYEEIMNKLSVVKNSKNSSTVVVQSITTNERTDGFRSDESAREAMRNFGVSMVNQNIDASDRIFNQPAKVDIPEVASTLRKLLSRPILIVNADVPAGTFGTVASIQFPRDWIAASKAIIDINNAYFFFKGKIRLQATLQSTPYNAGAMVVHSSYKLTSSFNASNLDSIYNAWIRPHTEVDYSDNAANKIMDVPWKYKREYCDFSAVDDNAICEIYCDNYSPNSTEARLLVYMWVEDADVVVTRVNNVPAVQGITLFGDTVTNVNTTNQIGSVEGNIMPANITGDQFDTKASLNLSALDQPNIPIEPHPVIMNREPTTSNGDQIQHKEKLALYPKEQIMSNFDTFGIDQDEMSIDYLKRKWSLLNLSSTMPTSVYLTYSTSTSPYTVLGGVSVGPYAAADKMPGVQNASVGITFLDYITRHHTFWRGVRGRDGAMEYRLKVMCNRFQSGRIAIAYNPTATWYEMFNTFSSSGLTFTPDNLGSCYVAYFDVNGQNNEIVFRVPYVSATPWKTVWSGSVLPIPGVLTAAQLNQMLRDSFAGTIVFLAITPLVSPVGSPTSVQIVPFVRGAPGYEIAGFSQKNNCIGCNTYPPPITVLESATPSATTLVRDKRDLVDLLKKTTIKVQSQTSDKIRIDCWDILRQILRMPRIELELPYYLEKRDDCVKVQGDETVVFLGDNKEVGKVPDDMICTRSLREICKRFVPYANLGSAPVLLQLSSVSGFTGYNNLCRVLYSYTLPVLPLSVDTPMSSKGLVRIPSWMQWGFMYQAHRGSMKFRVRASIMRGGPSINPVNPIRPKQNFHIVVFLQEHTVGTVYGNLDFYNSNPNKSQTIGRSFSHIQSGNPDGPDYFYSTDLGLILMEASISEDACIDFEVPAHLFNKYNELLTLNPTPSTESRPQIVIKIYQDMNIYTGAPTTASALASNPNVLQAVGDSCINLESWIALGDEARFGVLDEFPQFLSAGTDQYIFPDNQLPPLSVGFIQNSLVS